MTLCSANRGVELLVESLDSLLDHARDLLATLDLRGKWRAKQAAVFWVETQVGGW